MSYMEIAERASELGECKRKKTGAVIVHINGAVSIGYNSLPLISKEICNRCPREGKEHGQWDSQEECPIIHAEVNAIIAAARHGRSCTDAVMFCTYKPCLKCAQMIAHVGIDRVFYRDDYEGDEAVKYLTMCHVKIKRME